MGLAGLATGLAVRRQSGEAVLSSSARPGDEVEPLLLDTQVVWTSGGNGEEEAKEAEASDSGRSRTDIGLRKGGHPED